MNTCLKKKQKGFSLVELLVVISIIGILAALIVPAFNTFNRRQTVKQAAKQLKADLRLTQNRAVSSIENSDWGVVLSVGSNSYQISKFIDSGGSWATNGGTKNLNLPNGIKVSSITGPSTVVFKRLTGIPTNAPDNPVSVNIQLQWATGPSITQTVTISGEGNIE